MTQRSFRTRKLWLGLSAVAVTSALPSTLPQAAASAVALEAAVGRTGGAPAPAQFVVAQAHEHGGGAKASGGEGGEGGEGAAAKIDADSRLDPAVRFYRDIQLVRGHLLVGDELVKDGRWAEALPHFLHPVEELYDKLAPRLKKLDGKPFLAQLKALAQAVKAKNAAAYDTRRAILATRLDEIDALVKADQKAWLPFAVETALETMRSAIGEYGESIESGKFTKAVEYQDSRGFVWQAEKLLASVAPQITAKDADAAAKSTAAVGALKAAWPAVLPPAAPVLDAAAVTAAVSKVELALSGIR